MEGEESFGPSRTPRGLPLRISDILPLREMSGLSEGSIPVELLPN